MNNKRKKPITILKDGFNEIVFKPNTNKVVVGINTYSWYRSKYKSFKCKTEGEAKEIGLKYIDKYSKSK